jgi:hypothetical protein
MAEASSAAKSVWDGFRLARRAHRTRPVPSPLEPAIMIFFQATRTYGYGCFDLAALGCRSAVESAGYLFLTTKMHVVGGWASDPPRSLNGEIRRILWQEIVDGLKAQGVLSAKQLRRLQPIKEHGDLIAHYAAKNDRAVDGFVKRLSAGKLTKAELRDGMESGLSPIETLTDLQSAADILLTLDRAAFRFVR